MSMYKQFKTDEVLERNGIILNYGDFRVTIARAGGANKKYLKQLEAQTKPYRRAIQMEVLETERALAIYKRVYAQTIVLDWELHGYPNEDGDFVQCSPDEVPEGFTGEWLRGIENPEEGQAPLPVNVENVERVLLELNDLFMDIKEQAEKSVLFRKSIQEEEAKN